MYQIFDSHKLSNLDQHLCNLYELRLHFQILYLDGGDSAWVFGAQGTSVIDSKKYFRQSLQLVRGTEEMRIIESVFKNPYQFDIPKSMDHKARCSMHLLPYMWYVWDNKLTIYNHRYKPEDLALLRLFGLEQFENWMNGNGVSAEVYAEWSSGAYGYYD